MLFSSTTRTALLILVLVSIGWIARCHRLEQMDREAQNATPSGKS